MFRKIKGRMKQYQIVVIKYHLTVLLYLEQNLEYITKHIQNHQATPSTMIIYRVYIYTYILGHLLVLQQSSYTKANYKKVLSSFCHYNTVVLGNTVIKFKILPFDPIDM